jgi:hypothetical protein
MPGCSVSAAPSTIELSRGWYYKAAALGEIKMLAVRQWNAVRGVRLVVYDSVAEYIRRASQA